MFYPQSLQVLREALPHAARKFKTDESFALLMLYSVLQWTLQQKIQIPTRPDERGDPIITCELCENDQWWKDNYGAIWEWAQWWHCGPFGLDCGHLNG